MAGVRPRSPLSHTEKNMVFSCVISAYILEEEEEEVICKRNCKAIIVMYCKLIILKFESITFNSILFFFNFRGIIY